MNVLLLGNSHLAALRHAHRLHPGRWPLLDGADFFGLPGTGLRQMELREGVFYPRDAAQQGRVIFYNGIPDLPVSGYDRVVIVGGVKFNDALWSTEGLRTLAHPAQDDRPLVSQAFFRAALDHVVQHSVAAHLMRQLAPLAPLLYLTEPFPSEEALVQPAALPHLATCSARGEIGFMADAFSKALRQGLICPVLDQPAQTLAAPGLTLRRFMQGSLRLNPRAEVPHDDDVLHGNTLYGVEAMDQIESALAGQIGGQTAPLGSGVSPRL